MEPDETPADAAVREMWEETGLYVKLTRILGVFGGRQFFVKYANGDEVTYVMTVFDCEILEMAYFSREDLDVLNLAPWAATVLPCLFDNRNHAVFKEALWAPPETAMSAKGSSVTYA